MHRPHYIVLPRVISTNNLFRNVAGKGRVDTGDYGRWKREASALLMAQRPLPKITAPVELTFYVGERGVGNMDASNTLKALEDALVFAGVLKDDSRKYVRASRAVWVPQLAAAICEIIPARPSPDLAALLRRIPVALHPVVR